MAAPGPGSSDSQTQRSADSSSEMSVGLEEVVEGNRMTHPPAVEKNHRVVLNGLQLSLKKHKQAFAAYNYALTPSMDAAVKTDWKVLTGEGVECQHICYHQLQAGDNIAALASSFKKSHAVGVVLVNVEDSTELPAQFTQEAEQSGKIKSNFPIVVISSSDGLMLQEALNHHDPGEINAKIEHKNQPEVKLLQRMLPIKAEHTTSPSLRSSFRRQSFRGSLRLGSKRGIDINLKELVKTLMLSPAGPQCVSKDLALFQHLISAFYQYEQMAEREGPRSDGAVFRKLTKHMEDMFEKDFPFYITTAYRVHRKQQVYNCDELSPFIQSCVDRFEKLPSPVIAETVIKFLAQENFRVMVEPNSTPTVFELLEESCVQMMGYSASMRRQEAGSPVKPSHRQLYHNMLWISVAYKCHVERGSRVAVHYWKEYITSKHQMIYLNTDSIQSIRKGVEFGCQLELPDNAAFGSEHMAEILAAEGSVRPFNQMREFAVVLEQYISQEEEFVVNFIKKPRLCYEACFSLQNDDRLKAVHPDGNLLVIVQEGILFLDSMLGVICKRSWQSSLLEEEIKQWLRVLLCLVDITSNRAESYLKDFLATKSGGVTKQFREYIKRGVICKVQENISRLSVEQFYELYQAFLIWPTWLVEQYLRQYEIPSTVKICSLGWRDLFSEFVDRFDSRHHKSLLEFLQSVGVSYLSQGRATDFVLDLLKLDVPTLFVEDCEGSTSTLQSDIVAGSVSEEFSNFLTDYILRNNLRKTILDRGESIWESLAERSDFQQLILIVLQEELIPESSVLKGALMAESSIRYLIDHCVTTICKKIASLQEMSSRLNFCWGILASCCSRIPISDTFEWVHLFTFVIDQLGRVYGVYCQVNHLSEEGMMLKDSELPCDVANSPCEEVRKVFKWVFHAQRLLSEWTHKFNSRKINYDEIQLYHSNFSNISRVAALFYANAEMTDMHKIAVLKTDFSQTFELLNIFMIRYLPGKVDLGWCGVQHLLTTYGIGFPSDILTTLCKYVIFPGETASRDKRSLTLSSKVPAAISKNFQPGVDVSLQITRDLDLHTLKKLVQALAAFLSPVEDSLMQMLVFFYLNESTMFDKYLRLKLRELDSVRPIEPTSSRLPQVMLASKDDQDIPLGITMEVFANALYQTKELLLKLITGNATYTDIIADHSHDLKLLNTDHEFQILKEYAEFSHVDADSLDGLIGFKAMLQLFQLTRHMRVIHSVCVQFQLKECLEDPQLKELLELVETLEVHENRRKLTTNDAIEKMQVVRAALCLDEKMDIQFLNLFTAVADSSVFYQFVIEKEFVGEDGQALFNQQYQLITTQLQHEEYKEVVLNHLFAAFKLITPFMDRQQTFPSLMSQVASLGAYDASKQMETVNTNINLIRLWFSRAEGDTVEGVSHELNYVMDTGYYQFSLILTANGVQGNVELLYRRSVYSSGEVVEEGPNVTLNRSSYLVEVKWNTDHINDFVRKLGFLDAEGETGTRIDHFLYLNQEKKVMLQLAASQTDCLASKETYSAYDRNALQLTAKKLIDLYVKLRELGHPDYLKAILSHNHILPCALEKQEADHKVQQVGSLLISWEQQVAQLRVQYEQLLFFSVPKLLHLYDLIISRECQADSVAKEVGFLFRNKSDVQLSLRAAVEGLLQEKKFRRRHQKTENTPMHIVGAFLSQLFKNFELSSHSLKKRRPSIPVLRSMSTQSTHILHSCQGYNQSKIIRLIISIYGGVPEAFEVLRCRYNTTKQEIQLFLNPKRATKRPFQYLILEVNKLPYQLQEALLELLSDLKQRESDETETPCVHFIETGPSLLHEIPYILHRNYKGKEPDLDFKQAMMTCQRSALNTEDFSCIKLVYGEPGEGKTHYIKNQLSHSSHPLRVTVNESFRPLSAIQKLSSLPFDLKSCAVVFNITLLPPGDSVDKAELQHYEQLLETIGWFFFDLFVLGYVEDPVTGHSFRFPCGMSWAIYIEVPSRNEANVEESLELFFEDLPALGMLGTPHLVCHDAPYIVDEEVQLVCKYLKAYRIGGTKGIDRLYKEGSGFSIGKKKQGVPVKLSQDPELSEEECHSLLHRYIPENMKTCKMTQNLFVKYMKRRCEFLDNCPAFNYNSGSSEYVINSQGQRQKNDTKQLGSTLMHAMLNEVSDFCDPIIRENWALKPHHQLIYDFKDGGCTFALMSLHPDQISREDMAKFQKIGVEIPSMMELYSREKLDSYLSRALNIPLNNGKLEVVDESGYVLTLDFAIKMLNIHERAECRVPVIIEGETGVGKTALVEMLSKLWNCSLTRDWVVQKSRMVDFINQKISALPKEQLELYPGCIEAISSLTSGDSLREDELILIGEVSDETVESGQFYSFLRAELLKLISNPFLFLIEPRQGDKDAGVKFSTLFAAAEYKNNAKDTGKLLYSFLNAEVKSTFHKLNIHSALKPEDVIGFLEPVFKQARDLTAAYEGQEKSRTPFVSVFLDEINTTSCLGLFKELIVDHTLNGEPIPDNLFIIAACNPHRGNSLVFHETWMQGSYYVRRLHPSMQGLMWDYGALGEAQEREYIQAKLRMSNQQFTNVDLAILTNLIVSSQNQMRAYALNHMRKLNMTEPEASACSRSCVSQRDIQRVFTFTKWLHKMYDKFQLHCESNHSLRATLVALGLVYYLRLDSENRKHYRDILDRQSSHLGLSFSKVFDQEINWYISHIYLPEGIAKTEALKENLFATIVCTMTHTPLIMVGSPGSSKTLSFNLAIANMKGLESKVEVFRNVDIFKSLDPQVYQCSRRTTSNEIQTVFSRAINRQTSHAKVPLPVYCVVFMDEAGLPEERHESLKVLHYFLDSQEVSFIAISNHVLDAAKTNRAVSLFRPSPSSEDLVNLAKGCLCTNPDNPPPTIRQAIETVTRFCAPYEEIMARENFKTFFGLRDFIHFISYLRRKKHSMLSPQLVMEAVERNFNGVKEQYFQQICELFLQAINSSLDDVHKRNILEILQSSLEDHPTDDSGENQMRYKLIIDASEDGSVMRFLFSFGVLDRNNTRIYVLSDFPEDTHLQKINTIAAIRHSATEGHTILMSQTDAIHESFYDLFNRRFHCINASDGPRFYSNIAIGAHIKPCRIHPDFQCVVVVKMSELKNIPPPFLNRFEKYYLSHKLLLDTALDHLPPFMARVICIAKEKAAEFVEILGGKSSIYGYHPDTIHSLILTLLPPIGFKYEERFKAVERETQNIKSYFLENLLNALSENAGFNIPVCLSDELVFDSEELFKHICKDSEFAGYIPRLSSEVIQKAIVDGLKALFCLEPPVQREARKDIGIGACITIQLFCQWLARFLCKRLMQLTTSEAVCIHQKNFPSSYVLSYLNYQHHFSLKSLLENHYSLIQSKRAGFCSTKVVCFTRSSQILHQAPSSFPHSVCMTEDQGDETIKHMEDWFFSDTKSLQVHKLSSVLSYTNMKEVIKTFSRSNTHSVLLLIVNMQETSKDVINQIRIMIEEVENGTMIMKKLFSLVLHFPSSMASISCYDALFLQGWDFHYLDVVGCSPKGEILDIRHWFRQCYFTKSIVPADSVSLTLNNLICEAIPIIAARVFFQSEKSSSFNRPMTVLERTALLQDFLIGKGVGDILIERFNSYWQPSVMVEYLEKAAKFTQKHETNLNITDSLQSIFKRLFFDFLVYIISKINEGMNIDVIFNKECPVEIYELFLNILRVYPIPKLSELRMFHIVGHTMYTDEINDSFCSPHFPFFKIVATGIEKVVDLAQLEINQNVNVFTDQADACPPHYQTATMSRRQLMKGMIKRVYSELLRLSQSDEPTCLTVALRTLLNCEGLWQKYLDDFTHQKLHLDLESSGISHKIMLAAFGKLDKKDQFTRLAILHTYVHIHKLDLARVVAILRPLDKIEVTASILLSMSEKIASPTQLFLSDVEDSGDFLGKPEALSIFIIETLFCAISVVALKYKDEETELPDRALVHVQLWFKAYRDVMAMPTLQDHIYRSRPFQSVQAEAQHDLMHVLFLMVQCSPERNQEIIMKGLKVFNILFKTFFSPTGCFEHWDSSPKLKDIAVVTIKVLTGSDTVTALGRGNHVLKDVLEGLLAHFFSEHQCVYHEEDIRWVLEVSNQQSQWQVSYLMNEVIDAAYSDDLLLKIDSNLSVPHAPIQTSPVTCVSICSFKFYLMRILKKSALANEDSVDSIMCFFKNTKVHGLMKEVLLCEDVGSPQPYIPTFYQFCAQVKNCEAAESKLMQQPLVHLYFLTIFEDLLGSEFNLSALIKTSQSISKQCRGGATEPEDTFLLYIENQAVVQVILKELAHHLNLMDDSKVNAVCSLLTDINEILDDTSTGGGNIGGHSLVLVMHMLKEMESFQLFTRMLTDQFNLLCDGINCLESYHQKLTISDVSKQHVTQRDDLGCVVINFGSEFDHLYTRVSCSMHSVHTSNGNSSKVREFVHLAQESVHGQLTVSKQFGGSYMITRLCGFKIAVWLCVFNDFFNKQKLSPILMRVFVTSLSDVIESHIIKLFAFFLYPESVLQDGYENQDPVYSLFKAPIACSVEDYDLLHLRTALAKMIAVVVGLPPETSHLWIQLFKPEELQNTYIAGFMYKAPIGATTYFFDNGLEITQEGLIKHHNQDIKDNQSSLSLHSLHLLLWLNISTLCVHLLFERGAERKLAGKIISPNEYVRFDCVFQVRKLWKVIKKCIAVSSEERDLLVEQILIQHFEVISTNPVISKFHSLEELKTYEDLWQFSIFTPIWTTLRAQFLNQQQFFQNEVYINIQSMDQQYPWIPDENTLAQALLCQDRPNTDNLQPLFDFVMEYERLKLGSVLLPTVLELYQWLHTELSYSITYEEATQITFGRLAKVVAKRLPAKGDSRVRFGNLKDMFNEYTSLSGRHEEKRHAMLSDETPLLHMLSYKVNGEQGSDVLCCTIMDIITFHNDFLNALLYMIHQSSESACFFPESVPCIHAIEFTQHYGLTWSLESHSDLLQLIHSCSQMPTAYPVDCQSHRSSFMGDIPGNARDLIDLNRLQRIIMSIYIAGKPIITKSSIESIRIPFKFKERSSVVSLHLSLHAFSTDLQSLSQTLPNDFKGVLDERQRKQMEYEFHSATYHTLMEIITGLRTVIGHLLQELSLESKQTSTSKEGELMSWNLAKFLTFLYQCESQECSDDVFSDIGIHSLSAPQLLWMKNLCLTNLFDCWNFFIRWAEEGWYDFSSLPYAAKMPMNLPDEDAIIQIPTQYEGSLSELVDNIKSLMDSLSHLEGNISKILSQKSQDSLVEYLEDLQLYSKDDKLMSLIPDTIKLEQYVCFRILLKRILTSSEREVVETEFNSSEPDIGWTDFIGELWHSEKVFHVTMARSCQESDHASFEILNDLKYYTSEDDELFQPNNVPLPISPPTIPSVSTNSPTNITVSRVTQFLQQIKLEQYVDIFQENEIDGDILIQSSDEDLEEIGVLNALHRLKIRICIKRLIFGEKSQLAVDFPSCRVAEVLNMNKQLKQFSRAFLDNDMDAELLHHASDTVLKQLGVFKGVHMRMIRNTINSL